jgi:hypothetical protein
MTYFDRFPQDFSLEYINNIKKNILYIFHEKYDLSKESQSLSISQNNQEANSIEEEFFAKMYGVYSKNTIQNELEKYLEKEVEEREAGQDSDWVLLWWKVYFLLI